MRDVMNAVPHCDVCATALKFDETDKAMCSQCGRTHYRGQRAFGTPKRFTDSSGKELSMADRECKFCGAPLNSLGRFDTSHTLLPPVPSESSNAAAQVPHLLRKQQEEALAAKTDAAARGLMAEDKALTYGDAVRKAITQRGQEADASADAIRSGTAPSQVDVQRQLIEKARRLQQREGLADLGDAVRRVLADHDPATVRLREAYREGR